jgi:glycosyltransferase involved in cell wall biosynthesis
MATGGENNVKIGFLLGSPDINGGTYVIYEHATRLIDCGHEVSVITEASVTPQRYSWHPRAGELRWLNLEDAEKRSFDIILPTWWQSIFLLPRLTANHFVYFVQSIESRFFRDEDPLDSDLRNIGLMKQYRESSYTLNIPVITEARWIQDYLYEQYNKTAYLVRNGIRKDIYREEGVVVEPRVKDRVRVLVEGPVDVHYKNVPKSIELCRQAGIEEIWLLTSSDVQSFPGVDRVFSRVAIEDTPAIYRSCDVLVKLSYIEGMFGPPLEMFHCGGTAIVYDVTGHDEYIVHGENSYVVPRDQDDEVVGYLEKLRQDPGELARLKAGAAETARAWPGWQHAALGFENALQDISSEPHTSRHYVSKWLEKLVSDNTRRFQQRELDSFRSREHSSTSEDQGNHNFIQVYYWAEEDGLDPNGFKGLSYKSGTPVELSVTVTISGFPFWLRIDPSVSMGIISVDSIRVVDKASGSTRFSCESSEQFDSLFGGGTIKRIGGQEKALYLSTGDDPQLVLPPLKEGKIGDQLEIVIRLQESGIGEYLEAADKKQAQAGSSAVVQQAKRLVQRMGRYLK